MQGPVTALDPVVRCRGFYSPYRWETGMRTIAPPSRTITLSDDDLNTVANASRRLASDDDGMSQHEFNAAAIVNGRLDLLESFRKDLVLMGRAWAHATIEVIFDHWDREMTLAHDDPANPIGDQRIFSD